MKIPQIFVLVPVILLLVIPESSSAQSLATLAQCSGTDCSFCNLVHLANGLIKWLIGFLFILFGVLMAVAGFKLVTSGGNQSALDDAKESLTNAIIGIIIVLAAWLIVDTIMRGLVGTDENPGSVQYVTGWLYWSEVECQVQVETEYNQYEAQEIVDTTGAVDLATLPGYSGGRAVLPVIPQTAGYITYENGTRIPAYTLNTTQAPYNYAGCSSVTPPVFFNINEAGGVQISQYFSVCELTNCGAGQRAGEFAYLDPRAVAAMDRVAAAMGGNIKINSGYRSPSYNSGLDGSAECSQHMAGKAFDIAAGTFSTSQIEQICLANGAGWTKRYDTFTHCDWR